ncbi:hypothetical protein WBJ53_04575 [Spirosoma sp. SC4-14]|uniref:hypothetical protein n=1 Tax=Spirosoma sp. SC4-14 TaxID=3128900 RepID=UPI0030D2AA12
MKITFLAIIFSLAICPSYSQNNLSLKFVNSTLSPAQFIHQEFIKISNGKLTDTLCFFGLYSVRFTVTAKGKILNIIPSVGFPNTLKDAITKSIKSSEANWRNLKKANINCILPVMVLPASECSGERPFLMLQSGAQMFKYEGDYINFQFTQFYNYNINMTEGVILPPILLHNGAIN